jgi:hypothetical protein
MLSSVEIHPLGRQDRLTATANGAGCVSVRMRIRPLMVVSFPTHWSSLLFLEIRQPVFYQSDGSSCFRRGTNVHNEFTAV